MRAEPLQGIGWRGPEPVGQSIDHRGAPGRGVGEAEGVAEWRWRKGFGGVEAEA